MQITAIVGTIDGYAGILVSVLESLDFVDEVLVTDVSSGDETERRIKGQFKNVKYFRDTELNLNKRIMFYKNIAKGDYVLLISHDEIVTETLRKEILLLRETGFNADTYLLHAIDYSYGVCFGLSSVPMPRLVRRELLDINTSEVHSEIKICGQSQLLNGQILHMSNPHLGITAKKLFKFEMINAFGFSEEKLSERSLLDRSNGQIIFQSLLLLMKLNYRFLRVVLSNWRYGYGAVCLGYSYVVRGIAIQVMPTYVDQVKRGIVKRDDDRGF